MDAKDNNNFDPNAWQKAYQDADLPEDTKRLKAAVEDSMAQAGIPGQVTGIEGALNMWAQQERDQMNLIHAELGDDTFVSLTGTTGKDVWDLAGNKHSWPVYTAMAEAYRRKGDEESVDKMLSIFPEHSQLKEQVIEQIKNVRTDTEYQGYDSTQNIGKISEIKIGHQYDIRPGRIDFRDYIKDGNFDEEAAALAMLDTLKGLDPIYAEDWEEVNHTLENIRKEYGDEGREKFWVTFEKKFREDEAKKEESK